MAGFIFLKNFFDKSLLLSSDYLLPTLPLYYAHKAYHTGTAERFESRRKKNAIAGIV